MKLVKCCECKGELVIVGRTDTGLFKCQCLDCEKYYVFSTSEVITFH